MTNPGRLPRALARSIAAHGVLKKWWCRAAGIRPDSLSKILSGERLPTLIQATLIEAASGIPAGAWLREVRR